MTTETQQRSDVCDLMLNLATEIAGSSRTLLQLDDEIAIKESDLAGMEADIRSIVANSTDVAGKPSYSNDEKRKAAVAVMLNESETYRDLRNHVRELRLEREHCRIDLQFMRDRYNAYRAFLSIN